MIYQIYPRSFCDTDGDGVGDLPGVRRRLDHLRWLGVDALWMSPIFRSPMADAGYDVADYCDIDPTFGSLADADALIAEAHDGGLRVLLDWVPNHTSDRHPWFVESRSSRDNPRRDWYYWRDGRDGGPPNNWREVFHPDRPAWTFDDRTGQWYYHTFLPAQPDLNWDNPAVEAAMHDTLRFWLDRGVDGFRMDVIHMIGKDPTFPDAPPGQEWTRPGNGDRPRTHELIRGIRAVLDAYPGDRVAVGEVFLTSIARIAPYYGHGDELHLAFNFPALFAAWEAPRWRTRIERTAEELDPRGAWPAWVLSNHDVPRHRTRYGGRESTARAAAVLLLTLRGTPFLYAGEELGLLDAEVRPHRRVDPGGRDGCRAPLPWEPGPAHGWATEDPWLPWPPEADVRNVATQRDDPDSILHLYRRLLAARRSSPALALGSLELLDVGDPAVHVAWRRHHDDDPVGDRVVVVSWATGESRAPVPGGWVVEVSTDRAREGSPYDGRLGPEEAVVLRPA